MARTGSENQHTAGARKAGRRRARTRTQGRKALSNGVGRTAPQPAATAEDDSHRMVADLLNRLQAIRASSGSSSLRLQARLAAEAAAELQSTMEELRVAQDEMEVARHQAEAERRRYSDLFEFAPDGYFVTNPRGSIQEANRSAVELLNIAGPSLAGKPLVTYIHADDRPSFWAALATLEMEPRGEWTFRITPRGGETIFTQVSISTVRGSDGKLEILRWVIRDVTRQKLAEEALAESRRQLSIMASELLLAEERERRRIASDIHDHIGQALAVMQMRLGALRAACPHKLSAQFDELRGLLAESLAQTRTLSFELSPPVLYELGLEAALHWLTEQKSRDAGKQGRATAVEFRDDGSDKPLAQPVQVLIFQVVRELLANVIRHSGAAWARVSIWRDRADVVVSVEDDGTGFDLYMLRNPSRKQTDGFGLFSIRERLTNIGGEMTLDNRPGGGAKVTLIVPLRAINPAAATGSSAGATSFES